jgi:hypothetical protein
VTDYASTPSAAQDRLAKVRLITDLAWELGCTPEHILHAPERGIHGLTDRQWQALSRRATARPATGKTRADPGRPSSEETRRLVYCLLSWREACAAAEPGHPDARRTVRTLDEIVADLTTRRPRK